VLYCIVLYCVVLCCVVFYFVVLYCLINVCILFPHYDKNILLHIRQIHRHNYVYIKVKQSRYRPGVAQRVPGSSGSQIA